MIIYVLLFDSGKETEGIHSIEISGTTVVLMYENVDDAERYAGLLEAQDFPKPTIESIDREEIELFCRDAGYNAKFVPSGFVPKSEEERLFLSPPEANLDISNWSDDINSEEVKIDSDIELDDIKRRLEDLL